MRDDVYIVFFIHDAGGRREEANKGTSGTVALSIPGVARGDNYFQEL